jgi:hypothetical protein
MSQREDARRVRLGETVRGNGAPRDVVLCSGSKCAGQVFPILRDPNLRVGSVVGNRADFGHRCAKFRGVVRRGRGRAKFGAREDIAMAVAPSPRHD